MQNNLLVHKHLIIRAEALRPPMDEEQLKGIGFKNLLNL